MDRPRDSWLVDVGLFVLTSASHAGQRLMRLARRGWWLQRRLRGTRELVGPVEVLRPVSSPITRTSVAACRLTVEQALDDGSWMLIHDDTRAGELVIRSAEGPVRLSGPLELILPPTSEHDGRVLDPRLPVDEDDLRVTEYLLAPGQWVQLLGVTSRPLRPRGPAPYREAPGTPDLRWRGLPLVSHWPRDELLRRVWRGDERLPADLRGVPRRRG